MHNVHNLHKLINIHEKSWVTAKAVRRKTKMGIDKKTIPTYINVVLDYNPEYIKLLKKQAEEHDQNQEGKIRLSLTEDKHAFQMEEYYFEDTTNSITITGNMVSDKGESFLSIQIPLSDTVLVDILQHAVKRLNKLKTVLETLN